MNTTTSVTAEKPRPRRRIILRKDSAPARPEPATQRYTAGHRQSSPSLNRTGQPRSKRRGGRPLWREFERGGREIQAPWGYDVDEAERLGLELAALVNPTLSPRVHGWRPGYGVHSCHRHINRLPGQRLKFDIVQFFHNIDHRLLRKVICRLDPALWNRIDRFLDGPGIPNGFHWSARAGNAVLNAIDHRFPEAIRYCDNIIIISDDPVRVYYKMQRHLNDIGLEVHDFEINPEFFCGAPPLAPPRNSPAHTLRRRGTAPRRRIAR